VNQKGENATTNKVALDWFYTQHIQNYKITISSFLLILSLRESIGGFEQHFLVFGMS
jgi:hypothetical protein